MDFSLLIDAPFWQKMAFFCELGGVAIFMYFIDEIAKEVKHDFKLWRKGCKYAHNT